MHFSLIVLLSSIISVCQVLCESNNYESSDQQPWSFVYTLHPFFNTETLVEVWKTDKAVDASANVITSASDSQDQIFSYSDDIQRNDTNLKEQNNVQNFISETKSINEDQLSRNKQRHPSYRNKHKDANISV